MVQSVMHAYDAQLFTGNIWQTWGPYLDDARNAVVDLFLAATQDIPDDEDVRLLYVDSDIGFTNEDVERLIKSADAFPFDVVAGWYPNPFNSPTGDTFSPVVYQWDDDHTDLVTLTMDDMEPPHDSVLEVASVGAGFMLVPRALLLHMRDQTTGPIRYFCEPIINNVHFGEDHGFCLHAAHFGARVYVNPAVRVKHYKECIL